MSSEQPADSSQTSQSITKAPEPSLTGFLKRRDVLKKQLAERLRKGLDGLFAESGS